MKSAKGNGTNNGCSGCLGWSVTGITGIFFLILFTAYTPPYSTDSNKSRTAAAMNSVATAAKECAVLQANGEKNPTFTISKLKQYKILPEDRNCNGNENNLITALSTDLSKYPTYSYNVINGKKICFHNGENAQLFSCSAKRDGNW